MERLWEKIDACGHSVGFHRKIFLLINTVGWSLVGFSVWLIVQFFAFRSFVGAFCFAGYPGVFIGFIGGILFLWKK